MRILITGARGQVGSALCRLGAQTPYEIIGLDSRELDISDESAVGAVMAQKQPDVIVNAAAYTAVDKAEKEPELASRVNSEGPGNLARAAAKVNIPLLHFSTDYVFDGSKRDAYVETDPVAPLGVYGASKLAGEKAVEAEHGRHLIFRTSWVFGLEGSNFPKTMLRLATDRPELRVVADQQGCPTFADDIARTTFQVLGHYQKRGEELPWGLYHYAGQPSCSWWEFAGYIVDTAFKEGLIASLPHITGISTQEYPTPAKRPANSRLDCTKLVNAFPEVELSDWAAGTQELIKKIKNNNNKIF